LKLEIRTARLDDTIRNLLRSGLDFAGWSGLTFSVAAKKQKSHKEAFFEHFAPFCGYGFN
jgi:hypothetical protein